MGILHFFLKEAASVSQCLLLMMEIMCNIFSIHALSGFTLCANHMHIFRNVVPDANQLFHKFINKWIKINKQINI